MKTQYKEGELVYVQSEVVLNKYNSYDTNECSSQCCITKSPEYLLVVDGNRNKEVGVYFNGDTWFVNQKDVYNGDRV